MIRLAGLALAALALAPFAREALRAPMSARARRTAPGAFATLPQGVTHYRWLGAETGPVAVCVHGLTTPSFVWESLAQGLGDMGFRVLVYDIYGRGYSDRPRGLQDSDFLTRQLSDLLHDQNVTGDVTLLGYSMGGAVATAFAARHTDRLRQLVLIAPVGLGHDLGPASRLMADLGPLGTWAMLAVYGRSLRNSCEAERALASRVPDIADRQIAQLRYRGFLPAVLSSLRGILNDPLEDSHRHIAAAGLPVLALWGSEDDIIPISGKALLSDYNPSAVHAVLEGAGHTLPFINDAAVMKAFQDHLAR